MDFYDIVGQVLELLQRHGRVTYRALKAQFQLDDDLLETLKDELLFAHPVVDEEGRGLGWTAQAESPEQDTRLGTEDERHFQLLLADVTA